MPHFPMFSVFSFCFGLTCLIIGFFVRKGDLARDTRCDCVARGRVSGMRLRKVHTTEGYRDYWYPVIQYTALGRNYEREGPGGYTDRRFEVGDPVTVYYNSSDPCEFILREDGKPSLLLPALFIGFGVLWLVLGALSLLFFPF
jgi:Protein of unknown function (DUF3592).